MLGLIKLLLKEGQVESVGREWTEIPRAEDMKGVTTGRRPILHLLNYKEL